RRVVPAVRVPAVSHPDHAADIEHGLVAVARGEQPGDPRVVSDPVLDHEPRPGDGPAVGRGRLVAVRIGVGVGDEAHDVHVGASDLAGDAAPEVFRGDDLYDMATLLGRTLSCAAGRAAERDYRSKGGGSG